ncbi:MAG: beta-N-acetylhexosaminidase [Clostridia bacterium]|nr:beta-N-acetylhexosaminidase [Clostridia bacterium]
MRFVITDSELLFCASELLKEIPALKNSAVTVTVEKAPIDGLKVVGENGNYAISVGNISALGRALTVLTSRLGEKIDCEEKAHYDILGTMPDASRNAVMKVETVKKFARVTALAGFNAMMLYTEDTYEVKEYKYFGHLRGRYTAEEFKEMDAYCKALGIELIPCIQTLAHLNGMFEWYDYLINYNDCDDILLCDEEKTYELIECFIKTMSQNLTSRKINIGLDEAHHLGVGKYLDRKGYTKRSEIMARHLKRVADICEKYGYEPRMWSDMYFRMTNPDGVYRYIGGDVPQEIIDSADPRVALVYWDYVDVNQEMYDDMFRKHLAFKKNRIAFAGGDCSWYGLIPINELAYNSTILALNSIKKNKIKEVYCTMWKDDGAACSFFSTLTTLFLYGESCWSGKTSRRAVAKSLSALGVNFNDFMELGQVDNLPTRTHYGLWAINPHRYMFYADLLTGKYDAHIPDGTSEHFAKMEKLMRKFAKRNGEYGYIFTTAEKLASALTIKAELGKKLYKAYTEGDRDTLIEIATKTIDKVISRYEKFYDTFRSQWYGESKPFGFDVMDIRIGGIIQRFRATKRTLIDYLNGDLKFISELEQPRYPIAEKENVWIDGEVLQLNRWRRMNAQNLTDPA